MTRRGLFALVVAPLVKAVPLKPEPPKLTLAELLALYRYQFFKRSPIYVMGSPDPVAYRRYKERLRGA